MVRLTSTSKNARPDITLVVSVGGAPPIAERFDNMHGSMTTMLFAELGKRLLKPRKVLPRREGRGGAQNFVPLEDKPIPSIINVGVEGLVGLGL